MNQKVFLHVFAIPGRQISPAISLTLAFVAMSVTWMGCEPAPDGSSAANEVPRAQVQQQVQDAEARLHESEGGRRVLRAIEAHGGLEAWCRSPTSSYTWEYANNSADIHFESYLVADNQSRQVYHDLLTLGDYGDPQPVDVQFAWDEDDVWVYPDSFDEINVRFWALSGYYFQQIPFVLADAGLHYEVLPDEELDGRTHEMVRLSFGEGVGESPDDTYTLYIHPENGRVSAIRYTVTYGRSLPPNAEPRETLFYYEDYETVDGLSVPTRFRGFTFADGERGEFRNEAWADSISFRRAFDASRLEAPDGARSVPPPDID